MVQTAGKPDPESLVARIVAELEANPAAQPLLLRALLTNEFRGMPARLDHIEADIREMKVDIGRLKADVGQLKTDVAELKTDVAELKTDVAELKTDVAELKTDVAELKTDVAELKTDVAELKTDVADLKTDVAELKTDVAELKTDVADLKGDCLEFKLPQRSRAFLSQKLALRGARIMQSPLGLELGNELSEAVEQAADDEMITAAEETRILATDLILRARRKRDRSTVWVAVEASHTIDGYDIDRVRESADILRRLFGTDSVAVTVGYGVRASEQRRAGDLGVEVFVIERRAA